ncbi:MAG: hypothetical protein ACFBSG_12080 [Leptolyngbyaceae cyanobacterium]
MTNQQIPGHPYQNRDQYDQDLNPNPTAGFNVGQEGEKPGRFERTAADIEQLRSQLTGWSEADLQRIPVLKSGARLEQGATYVNLQDATRQAYTGMANDSVAADDYIVPKAEVAYDLWNRLVDTSETSRSTSH